MPRHARVRSSSTVPNWTTPVGSSARRSRPCSCASIPTASPRRRPWRSPITSSVPGWRKRLSSANARAGARTILCAGIIVLDEVFQVDRFPQPDAKTQAQSFFIVNGGCAANAAVAVARLGARAALAGPLGDDANGERVLAALAREEVDCSGCQRLAGVPTAVSAIFLDAKGERMIVTHCDDRLAAARPIDPARLVASTDAVLADNRFPEFVRPICEAARERGLMVVLDADRPTPICDQPFRIATHVG